MLHCLVKCLPQPPGEPVDSNGCDMSLDASPLRAQAAQPMLAGNDKAPSFQTKLPARKMQQLSRNHSAASDRAHGVLDSHARRATLHQQAREYQQRKAPNKQQAHEKQQSLEQQQQQQQHKSPAFSRPSNPFLASKAAAERAAAARAAVLSVTKGMAAGPMKRPNTPIRNALPSPAARAAAQQAARAAASAANEGVPQLHPGTFRRSVSPGASSLRAAGVAAAHPFSASMTSADDSQTESAQSSSRTGTGRSRDQLDAERIRWEEKYALRY